MNTTKLTPKSLIGWPPLELDVEVTVYQLVNGTRATVCTGPLLGMGDNPTAWAAIGDAGGTRYVFLGPGVILAPTPTGDALHPALR